MNITVFSNENIFVQLLQTVRSKDVFIIQPTCSPVHYHLMELLILIDTARRASAGRVTAVMPYYAYGRSDKKDMPRVPITAKLVANMVQVAGAEQIRVHFLYFNLESGYDYAWIDGTSNYWTGERDPFWSEAVEGDSLTVRFYSDYMVNSFGFTIDFVEYFM